MGCCLGKPLVFTTKSVVVLGTRGAGVSTVARRIADGEVPARRDAECEEEWAPIPLPCSGAIDEWPPTKRYGPQLRVVDVGASALLLDAEKAKQTLDRCSATVVVLDATRTLDSQAAGTVMKAIDASEAFDKPLVILLNKFDLVSSPLISAAMVEARFQLSKRTARWCCLPSVASHRFANFESLVLFGAMANKAAPSGPLVDLPSPASTLNLPPVSLVRSTAELRPSKSAPVEQNTTPRVGGYVQYDDVDPVRKLAQPSNNSVASSASATASRSVRSDSGGSGGSGRNGTPARDTELLPRGASSPIDTVIKPKGYVRLART